MSNESVEDLQVKVLALSLVSAEHINETILVFKVHYSNHNSISRYWISNMITELRSLAKYATSLSTLSYKSLISDRMASELLRKIVFENIEDEAVI